jgi:[acyl-carrier-protein] S-malonyltransferase
MAAVIGLSKEAVVNICEENSDDNNIVCPANFNSPQQIVISGQKDAVDKVTSLLKEAGAKRVVPLTVSAPFHCSLMNKAAEELKEVLDGINISEINVPIVTNVDAEANSDHNAITDLLFRQVVMPVRWYESVEYMKNHNIDRFIEIGPGNVLTGLIRRTVSDVGLKNLENLDHLNHINEIENGTKK